MNKKDLLEYLDDVPDDANIELSALLAVLEECGGPWEIILDQPIAGVAYNEDSNEIRFVVLKDDFDDKNLKSFGAKIKKLNNEEI